ncbi:MAG: DUF1559 domain-containing protein [Gemmataceae bacterium]|nr:DUF1559 domain-containing protein [Gemmataceae bacterium]
MAGICTNAVNTSNDSGSWGYQILPYVDQLPIYDSQTGAAAANWSTSIPAFLCAIRARPGHLTGGTVTLPSASATINGKPYTIVSGTPLVIPYSGSITISALSFPGGSLSLTASRSILTITYTASEAAIAAAGTMTGPATDFAINPYLNSPTGAVNAANVKRKLVTISDGSSNTILLGHAYVATSDYPITIPANSYRLPIFSGGTLATGRTGLGDTASTWLKDVTATTLNQWGSPMREGGLMAMGDGTVRPFAFTAPLINLLQPADNNAVDLNP